MLQLDDFTVPGKSLNVKGSMELRTEDIAGETSSTEFAEKGIKPKILRVSLLIPFSMQTALNSLIKVAEAKDKNGEMKIYVITNRTANAGGIKQVRFVEQIVWEEADSLQNWNVSFALQEHMSNPERAEKRQNGTAAATPSSEFSQVIETANNTL